MEWEIPQQPVPVPYSFQVVKDQVIGDHQENNTSTMYRIYMERVISPEGSTNPHDWLRVQSPYRMGPDTGKAADLGVAVSLNGRGCPRSDVFCAWFHESKPHVIRAWNEAAQDYNTTLYIDVDRLRNAAGMQAVDRLEDEPHWDLVHQMGWADVIASVGLGPFCYVMVRHMEDGHTYRVFEEDGAVEFQQEPVDETAPGEYVFPIEQFVDVDHAPFRRLFTAAGNHVLEQLEEEEEEA